MAKIKIRWEAYFQGKPFPRMVKPKNGKEAKEEALESFEDKK